QLRITAKEETQGSSIGAGYLKIYTLYIDYQENERIKLYFRK
ncbi:17436_t:CDS:1, partial [Rhizophagus irregularis]